MLTTFHNACIELFLGSERYDTFHYLYCRCCEASVFPETWRKNASLLLQQQTNENLMLKWDSLQTGLKMTFKDAFFQTILVRRKTIFRIFLFIFCLLRNKSKRMESKKSASKKNLQLFLSIKRKELALKWIAL